MCEFQQKITITPIFYEYLCIFQTWYGGPKLKSFSTLMIIPIIIHIHLAVILGMTIFPLAFLNFLFGLIWPKKGGKRSFLAIIGQYCPRLTASGKLIYFLILLRYVYIFHYDCIDVCAPCLGSYLTAFWAFSLGN